MRGTPFLPILPEFPKWKRTWVATSGGVDSMWALNYLSKSRPVGMAFFDHATHASREALDFVQKFSASTGILLRVGRISNEKKPRDKSWEEWWREERYRFLNGFNANVVTGHHLDDAMETWIMGAAHGTPKLPHLQIKNVYRPFLACRKAAIYASAREANLTWIEDPSNDDVRFGRNFVRKHMVEDFMRLNPGFDTVIQKKIQASATAFILSQPPSAPVPQSMWDQIMDYDFAQLYPFDTKTIATSTTSHREIVALTTSHRDIVSNIKNGA